MAARMAKLSDIGKVALGLPEVEAGTVWGDRPAYTVRGKAFLLFREPRPDAVDPDSGERMDDVIMFTVPDQADKDALVQGDGPWFTTPHFNGYNAVLLRQRHLGEVSRSELAEVITDAWAARAPKRVVAAYFAQPQASRRPSRPS